jgi:hypothetical protein
MSDNLNAPIETIELDPVTATTLDAIEASPVADSSQDKTSKPEELLAMMAAEFALPEENEEEITAINLPTVIQGLECDRALLSGTRRTIHALREAALLRLLDNRNRLARHERRALEKYNATFQAVNARRAARETALAKTEATVSALQTEYETALNLQAEMTELVPTISPDMLRLAVGQLLVAIQKTTQSVETLERVADFGSDVRYLLEAWPIIESAKADEAAPFFEKVKETAATLLTAHFNGEAHQCARAAVLHSTALWARVSGINEWLSEASALEARLDAAKAHRQEQGTIADLEAAEDEKLVRQAEAELLSQQAELRAQRHAFETRREFDGIRDVIAALDTLAGVENLQKLKELEQILRPYENILGEEIRTRHTKLQHQAREQEQEGWRQARERAMHLQAEGHLDVPGDNVLIAWPKSRLNGDKAPSGGPQVQVWNRESDGQYRLVQVHRLIGNKWSISQAKAPVMPLAQIAKTRDGSNVYRVTVSLATAFEAHLPTGRTPTVMGAAILAAVRHSEAGEETTARKDVENKKRAGKPTPAPKTTRSRTRAAAFATLAEAELENGDA